MSKPTPKSAKSPKSANAEPLAITVEELAGRTGVSVRNIRAYQTGGLLAPPRLKGRLGLYGEDHVSRLETIRDLRSQGFGLEAIRQIFERVPEESWRDLTATTRSLTQGFFTIEDPLVRPVASLGAKWGKQATPALRARARQVGLYRSLPKEKGKAEEIEILSPSLDRIGEQLALLGIPMDTVLDLEEALIRHSRGIARSYVERLFLTAWRAHGGHQTTGDASAELKTVFESLRPLAIGSLSAAFPVILQQEFDAAFKREFKKKT